MSRPTQPSRDGASKPHGSLGQGTRESDGRDQGAQRRRSRSNHQPPQRSRDRDHLHPIDNVISTTVRRRLRAARALDADRPGDSSPRGWPPPRAWSGPAPRRWDGARTPIHPLSMESAYADPELLRDLGARGARFARELGRRRHRRRRDRRRAAGRGDRARRQGCRSPSSASPGYRGHEVDEPPVRGADVAGRRVLLVDDAVSSGSSVERFTASLVGRGRRGGRRVRARRHARGRGLGEQRRRRAPDGVGHHLPRGPRRSPRPTASSSAGVHELSVDALVNRWTRRRPALGPPARWRPEPRQTCRSSRRPRAVGHRSPGALTRGVHGRDGRAIGAKLQTTQPTPHGGSP